MSHLKFDTFWLKCLIRLPRKPCEGIDLASRKNYHIRCRKRFIFFCSLTESQRKNVGNHFLQKDFLADTTKTLKMSKTVQLADNLLNLKHVHIYL